MSAEQRGKLIVICGANNVGKTTQIGMLPGPMRELWGINATWVKYPAYKLPPTGPLINSVLRDGRKMEEGGFQELCAQNQRDFEPTLLEMLEKGTWVLAEDYTPTRIAHGLTHGLTREFLEELNAGFYREDLTILLDGKRLTAGIERGHRNEDGADWERNRRIFRELADMYKWVVVEGGQSRPSEAVHRDIIHKIKDRFFL